jgi:hypothetical protein
MSPPRRDRSRALKRATDAAAARVARVDVRRFAPLWRAQLAGREPWWHSRRRRLGEGGRTDLAAPDGTVCFATSASGALMEKLWDPGRADPDDPDPQIVTLAALASVQLWRAGEDAAHGSVADLTDARTGLSKEFATAPYEATQAWADALRRTDGDGVVHWLRLDPADGRAVALFATGPDDAEPGFVDERFPLTAAGRGADHAATLPEQLFTVVDLPADEELIVGGLEDIPDGH